MADSTVLASITNKNYNDPIQFYAVSCEAYHSLCNDYSIMGYPTTYAVIPSPDQENNNNWTNTPKQQIHAFELNSEMLLNIFKMINRTNNNTTQQDPNTVSAIDSHDNNNRAEEEDQNDVNDDDVSGERENASLPTSESKTRNDERNKGKENNMLKKSINVPVHFNNINKFQDILKGQLRKQEQLRQKKPKHQPASMKSSFNGGDAHGATSIMKANRYGTKEYNLRKHKIVSQLLQKLKTNNHQKLSKVFHNNNANARKHQPMTESLPSFQKHISKPHFMERIPIINKFTAISKEEELIWDVSLAFIDSIKRSALLLNPILQQDTKNNNGVNIPFNATQQQIQHELLIRWLQLASISLPQEWSIHTTINDLLHNIATQKNENYENDSYILLQVLQRHPFQRSTYSPSCTYNKKILTTNDGFFCGFWKLLHVITVGIAMHRGGIDLIHTKTTSIDHTASNNNASVSMDIASSIFSPRDASNTMQQFISTFIQSSSCRDCISNFLTVHYDCEKHKKCYELTSNTYTAFENEWKMVALWLWEFHNDMSILLINRKHDVIRKYKQQHSIMSNWNNPGAGPGAASLHEEVTVVWPSVDMCFDCFNSDGAFDEETVFLHIEQSYW